MIFIKKHIAIFLLFICFCKTEAQVFPSQAFFTLSPPFPVYLSDYANPNANNIALKLLFRDFNLGTRNIRLKFTVTGQNFQTINLNQLNDLPEFTITAGQPLLLNQSDIAAYFMAENLEISPMQYSQPLPEGIYKFGVQIIDSESNRAISGLLESSPYWFTVNDPPIINLPQNGSKIKVINPQNIIFQWAPRNKQAAQMEYEFTLTELIIPEAFEGNLQQIFFSQPPYYQTFTNNTTLLYGPGEPPLIENRTYAVRIQAKAKKGLEQIGIFKNDGFSEVITFQYGLPKVEVIENQDIVTDKITLSTDKEQYLSDDFNRLIKPNQRDLFAIKNTKKLENYRIDSKKISINDTLRLADLQLNFGSNSYANVAISIPDFGSKIVKLYFNDSLQINSKNDVISGGLNLFPTSNQLVFKDSILNNNTTNIINKPTLFGSLLLLEDAKINNNNTYHEIRALAMKSPNEIREINLKLNAFLAYMKDKATLMDKISKNYTENLIFKEIAPKIVLEKKQTENNIKNLQEFLRKYDSYYKNDYAQQILKYLPDVPSNNAELSFYYDFVLLDLANLEKEKAEEMARKLKELKDEYQKKKDGFGSFPANMAGAEMKKLDDKLDTDILDLNQTLNRKYERLKDEAIKNFQKLSIKTEVK